MLFALSVLDFRCKDTKFPRQTSRFVLFFSPFNIFTAPTLRIHRRRRQEQREQSQLLGASVTVNIPLLQSVFVMDGST